jgi:predicted anti-sigma-YlaC factor YlaD
MDDCHAVMKLVYPYLDGELGEEDRCRVHTHLLGCFGCQGTFEAERSFLHLFRAGMPVHPATLTARQIAAFVERRSSDPEPPIIDRSP